MKASELKNKGVKVTLSDKEYELKFNMNTFCELEDVYGDVNKAFDDLQLMKMKVIRALLYASIKAEDDNVTLKSVGEMFGLEDLERLSDALIEGLNLSMPEVDENMGE